MSPPGILRHPVDFSMSRPESSDIRWMLEALRLAEKGRYHVSPNPMVGACLVRGKRLVGRGYHRIYGGDHAEIMALRQAGPLARGANLYVTLEPCSTWGKTPPCVQAIVRAGVQRVVVGMLDPNPRHRGRGVMLLRKNNIRVTVRTLDDKIRTQNESFDKFMRTGLPFVTLKMAQSLDGKICTKTGKSKWITSQASRRFVQNLRREADAVLIGQNTALLDDPSLTVRGFKKRQSRRYPEKPWRFVLDPGLKLKNGARIFEGKPMTFRVIRERDVMGSAGRKHGSFPGIAFVCPTNFDGTFNLEALLRKMASLGIARLLVEGGGETAWHFLKRGFVDKVFWFLAPKIIGGRDAKTSVEGDGVDELAEAIPLKNMKMVPLGKDWLLQGEPRHVYGNCS